MLLSFLSLSVLFTFAGNLVAQSSGTPGAKDDEAKGWTWHERFEGSSSSFGQVTKLDSSLGYNFNRYFGVDAGVPVYFVRRSSATSGKRSTNGIGNAYADLRLTLNNPLVNFSSTLTGSAPTGDTKTGLSSGRATFDWDNRFDRSIGGLTPFVDLGVANTVSDTHFFRRPFSSLGTVAHFEAGSELKLWHFVSIGASAYDVLPSGQQKIFSKILQRSSQGTSAMPNRGRVFETAAVTAGGTDLTRDNGFSTWLSATLYKYVDLELGYSRSVHFRLDSISFGIGLNLSPVLRKVHGL